MAWKKERQVEKSRASNVKNDNNSQASGFISIISAVMRMESSVSALFSRFFSSIHTTIRETAMVSKTVPKAAWVVVLTSTNNYIKGAIALAQALRMTQSLYPLVVLYTSAVTKRAIQLLKDAGCHVRPINPIHPPGKTRYVFERFVETWTKLAVWNLEEYERVVLLDADMLPLQNMDELMMDIALPDEHHIAACHACTCNPQKIKTYPADWYVLIYAAREMIGPM